MDVQTKELFGSMFEDVFQKAFRTSALVPPQRHVFSLSQPAVTVQATLTTTSVATQYVMFDLFVTKDN